MLLWLIYDNYIIICYLNANTSKLLHYKTNATEHTTLVFWIDS